jgi:DNA-binding transcriptional regulator GbsR (MarR family)
MQLLIYLIANANYQGSVNLTYKELETNLKLFKANISTAVKGLINRNIIIKSTSNGNKYKKQPNFYDLSLNIDRLNYNLAWKGKNKDYKQVQGKDPEIIHQPLLENKKNELFPNETI